MRIASLTSTSFFCNFSSYVCRCVSCSSRNRSTVSSSVAQFACTLSLCCTVSSSCLVAPSSWHSVTCSRYFCSVSVADVACSASYMKRCRFYDNSIKCYNVQDAKTKQTKCDNLMFLTSEKKHSDRMYVFYNQYKGQA